MLSSLFFCLVVQHIQVGVTDATLSEKTVVKTTLFQEVYKSDQYGDKRKSPSQVKSQISCKNSSPIHS